MWPVAAILAAAFGLVLATVFWVSHNADRLAAERQYYRVSNVVEDEADNRAKLLASITVSDDLWTTLGLVQSDAILRDVAIRATDYFDLAALLVFRLDGTLIADAVASTTPLQDRGALYRMLKPFALDFAERITRSEPGLQRRSPKVRTPRDFAHGQFAVIDGRPLLIVAAPLAPSMLGQSASWGIAVGYQDLNVDFLKAIGNVGDLRNVTIRTTPPGAQELAIPIRDRGGSIAAYLTWEPFLPGDVMQGRLVPTLLVVLAGALLVSGLVFAHVQRVALDVARSEEHTRKLVGHDPLSGLPNRLPFTQRLDQELSRIGRGEDGLAVLFLDLDRFKDVNDIHGHATGDELIRAVARRLGNLLRGADTLARFGGDEFAIIQTAVRQPGDVEALARRILADITQPFDIGGLQVSIGVSIGISLAPANGMDRELLMRLADTALYQAKNEGRNRFCFFERQMDETLKLRKLVEDDLRAAISENTLALHYQPQVSADGDQIVGVEALIRWPHAKRGMIPPAQFIPIAEERGLIIPLGEWVLRQACLDGLRWPNLRIAVNVSPIQFRHKDFVPTVMRIVAETGIDPSRLELELTEGVVVDDADAAEAAMIELRAAGIHLALDDFGTGYSSLIYLRRFAFDKIKIDRSFLESMEATGESAILVHSMVHLGRALGLTVTAEGVETHEQHRFLQAVGCHELQGYLFARPMPADQIDARLAALAAGVPGASAAAAA